MIQLSWEKNNPKRWWWSAMLYYQIAQYWDVLKNATDITKFRSDYEHLTVGQQQAVWAEIMCSDALYESSWDPECDGGVDAGVQGDIDTYSVGLWQMSVCDQDSYNLPFGYAYHDLQDVSANTHLAIAVMAQQISRYGTILRPFGSPGVYWSTMEPGGHDGDRSADIIARVQAMMLM